MELALFSYRRGTSPLHKAPSLLKMIFLFALNFFVFWESPRTAALRCALFFAASASLFFLSGANWKGLLKLRFVFYVGLMVFAIKIIGTPIAAWTDSAAYALLYTARFFVSALAAQCVFETTTMLQMQEALRLPLVVTLAINFIPQIFSEWQKIKLAARSRTSARRRKSIFGAASIALFEMQALLFVMLEKAETKRKALENRRQAAAPVPGQNRGGEKNDFLERTKNKVIRGCKIKKSEAQRIYNWPNLDELKSAAYQISQKRAAKKISACALINAKQGKCSEDCKYCAQSAHWNSSCQTKEMIEVSAALKIASQAAENGAERICVITSGRDLNGNDFEKALQIIRAIKEKFGGRLKVCASLGLLDKERLLAVKEAGASRAANNLETSEKYFPKICSTHTYRQKRRVVKSIKKCCLELCSGCIIGMGESVQDRIDAAFAFRKIGADSIPVNVLSPVKGTPFESLPPLADEDFYRTIAMLRFVNPKSQIRLAAGRKNFSDNGREALLSGANAFVTGGLLTLSGSEESSDLKMLEELNEKTREKQGEKI